jgi:hypothetical protein
MSCATITRAALASSASIIPPVFSRHVFTCGHPSPAPRCFLQSSHSPTQWNAGTGLFGGVHWRLISAGHRAQSDAAPVGGQSNGFMAVPHIRRACTVLYRPSGCSSRSLSHIRGTPFSRPSSSLPYYTIIFYPYKCFYLFFYPKKYIPASTNQIPCKKHAHI